MSNQRIKPIILHLLPLLCPGDCLHINFGQHYLNVKLKVDRMNKIGNHRPKRGLFSQAITLTNFCFALPDFQTSRPSDLQTFRLSDLKTFRPSDLPTFRPQDFQTFRPQVLQTSRLSYYSRLQKLSIFTSKVLCFILETQCN